MSLDVTFDLHGESVTYTPPSGSTETFTVVWRRGNRENEDGSQGEGKMERAECLIREADVTAAEITLSEDGTITRGSKTWAIESVPDACQGLYKLALVRHETSELSKQGYRFGR